MILKYMPSFTEMIDAYLWNYESFEQGKVSFDCDYGELTFIKDRDDTIVLYAIFVYPEHREKGKCRDAITYIIERAHTRFTYLSIQSVLSKILYEYLLRYSYQGNNFILTKDGFIMNMKQLNKCK